MLAGMETNPSTHSDVQITDTDTDTGTTESTSTAVDTGADKAGTRKHWLVVALAALIGVILGVALVFAFFRPTSVHDELYPGDNNSPEAAAEYINRSGLVAINADDFDIAAQKVCESLEKTDIESMEGPEQVWNGPEYEAGSFIDNAESFEIAGIDEVKDEKTRDQVTATGRRLVMETAAMFACPSQMARMNATFNLN